MRRVPGSYGSRQRLPFGPCGYHFGNHRIVYLFYLRNRENDALLKIVLSLGLILSAIYYYVHICFKLLASFFV